MPLPVWASPTGSTIWGVGDGGGAVLSAAFGGIGVAPVSGGISGPFPGASAAIYLDGSLTPTDLSALPSGWTADDAYTFHWQTICFGATDTIDMNLTSLATTVSHTGPDGGDVVIDSPLTGCSVAVLIGIANSTITVAMFSVTGFGPFFGDLTGASPPQPTYTWFEGTYTAGATPSVTSVTPASGSVAGGQTVTIRGEGFLAATGVTFGGTPAASYAITNDTEMTVVTPSHLSGAVDVEVLSVAVGTGLYTFVVETLRLPNMPVNTPIFQGGGGKRR